MTREEATQTDEGVSEESTSETENQPVVQTQSRRDKAYDAIIASREAEKTAAPAAAAPPEEGAEDGVTPPAEPSYIEFDVNGETVKVPSNAKYRAKINGQEIEQTVDNITRSYQKGAAADQRLEEATQKIRDAEAKAAELATKETELTAKEQAFVEKMDAAAQSHDDGDLSTDDYKEAAQAFIDSLSGDDESEMVDKVAKVFAGIGKQAGPTIDEKALLTKAEEHVFQRMETRETEKSQADQLKEQQAANDWFKTKYKDIAEDPRLMGAAKSELATVMTESPGLSQKETAKLVGDRIREWSGGKKAPTPPKTPRAAGFRKSLGTTKPPEGRDDVFNEMRKARGQPTL